MKEDIVHCKEGNPFVSIPAGLSLIVAGFTCLQLIKTSWLDLDTFVERALNGFFFLICGGLLIAICYDFFINHLLSDKTEANTVYIKTKSARIWLVVTIIASLALLAYELIKLEKPDFFAVLTSALFVLSLLGCALITLHILAALTIDTPNKIKPERTAIGEGFFMGMAGAVIACVSLAFNIAGKYPSGGSIFLLSSVSGVAMLWTESHRECIADREITPLATTSLAWIAATYSVKSYHVELSAFSFAVPYFVYLAPIGMLGAYYYITQPERG